MLQEVNDIIDTKMIKGLLLQTIKRSIFLIHFTDKFWHSYRFVWNLVCLIESLSGGPQYWHSIMVSVVFSIFENY